MLIHSPIVGYLLVVLINIIVFAVIFPPRTWLNIVNERVSGSGIFRIVLSALISDLLIHIIIARKAGVDETLMWLFISFFYILFLCILSLILILFVLKITYRFKNKNESKDSK
jgi:hypothetical protein